MSGGPVSGGNVTAEISTGSGIAGGVAFDAPVDIQAIDGFIGQLYDPVVVDIAASPDTVVDERDTRQLSATATMDDGTLLELDAVDLTWAVVSGPVSGITADGIATAETPIFADGPATVRGTFDGVDGDLVLTVINLLLPDGAPDDGAKLTAIGFELSWDTVVGATGYYVYLGTDRAAVEEATRTSAEFLGETDGTGFVPSSLLSMGTTYFWRIDTVEGTEVTQGDTRAFMTHLFQPDLRIGTKANPATHRGNNVHNRSGAGQTVRLKLVGKRKGKVYFSLENGGDERDDLLARGPRSNRQIKLRYFQMTGGKRNVTGAMSSRGSSLSDLDPASLALFRMDARGKRSDKRARRTVLISGTSLSDSRGVDVARAKVKAKPKK